MQATPCSGARNLCELKSFQGKLTNKLCYDFSVPETVSHHVLKLAQDTLAQVYSRSCAHFGATYGNQKFYYDYHYEAYMGVSDIALIATTCVIFALKVECGLKLKFSWVSPWVQEICKCDIPESIAGPQKGEGSKKRPLLFPKDLANPRPMHQDVCSSLRKLEIQLLEWTGHLRIC